MIEGKTTSGFAYKLDPEILNDAEFLEIFTRVQKGKNLEIFDLVENALGKEQKDALYEHCRGENGRVPLDRIGNEFAEIVAALNEAPETKN